MSTENSSRYCGTSIAQEECHAAAKGLQDIPFLEPVGVANRSKGAI